MKKMKIFLSCFRPLAALSGEGFLLTYTLIQKLDISFLFTMTLQYYGSTFCLRHSERYLDYTCTKNEVFH